MAPPPTAACNHCWRWLTVIGVLTTLTACRPVTIHHYLSVSAGWNFTCGLRDDHSLWCWGDLNGPLNDTLFPTPQQVTTDTDWDAVWSGYIRMCALKSDGSLWCWSWDEQRQEGVNYTTILKQAPEAVTLPPAMPAIQSFAPGPALQTCAVDVKGGLWCWGPNDFGEVGNGTTTPVANPVSVQGGPWSAVSVSGDDVWWAGAHTCALDSTGGLYSWGSDNLDQLGIASTTTSVLPTAVNATPAMQWKEIGTGTSFTCGIRKDGTVWCWGHSFDPNSSDITTVPWQISTETDWHGLSAGASWACALRSDASAWCWGFGTLGNGAPTLSNAPLKVAATTTWSSFSVGLHQACGLDQQAQLWCWGNNSSGEVGDGTINEVDQPTLIP